MPSPFRRSIGAAALRRCETDPGLADIPIEHRVDAVLDADDEYGRGRSLLVQADGVSWLMLDALVELALYGALVHKALPHQRGPHCRWCHQAETMWHTALIDPLLRQRRISATDLHHDIATAVAREHTPP